MILGGKEHVSWTSRLCVALLVLLSALSLSRCGDSGDSERGTPTPTPTPAPWPSLTGTFDYRGINHVSWWFSEYQGTTASDSRQALAGTGANWAGVLVTWYVASQTATTIAPDSQSTPSDAALIEAISHLHSRNVKVMLKPHVDSRDGAWRGNLAPSDKNAWFASYAAYMTQMARFAEQQHVEMLCVGTELATLSGSAYSTQWTSVIGQIRAEYHGLLAYAANANNVGDEFTRVSFWSQLDLAGLDAYAPLTTKNDPTREELVAGWSGGPNGDNMLLAFRNWQLSHGKPVVLTEIGYKSVPGANTEPWNYSRGGAYDPTEQANCYYAAFSVFLPERSWMKGAFWWAWPVAPPSAADTDYTPRNKPAGVLLAERYGGAT